MDRDLQVGIGISISISIGVIGVLLPGLGYSQDSRCDTFAYTSSTNLLPHGQDATREDDEVLEPDLVPLAAVLLAPVPG